MGGGGSRFQALLPDNFNYSLDIFDYIVVPKPHYCKTVRPQTVVSSLIVLNIFRMLSTVKLNDNPFFERDEVNNVFFNHLLSAELDTFKLTVSQIAPEQAFRISTAVT